MEKKSVHPLTLRQNRINSRQQHNLYHTESCFLNFSTIAIVMAENNRYVGLRVGMALRKKGENSIILFILKLINFHYPFMFS